MHEVAIYSRHGGGTWRVTPGTPRRRAVSHLTFASLKSVNSTLKVVNLPITCFSGAALGCSGWFSGSAMMFQLAIDGKKGPTLPRW